jgi:prepilin-type N-terminal cleavage/methylation domain-containing protein
MNETAKNHSIDTRQRGAAGCATSRDEHDTAQRRTRAREGGFTVIELMVTVAIIAVLAAIVVPSFTRESRKSKTTSEVAAMFGELSVREDQYKLENGDYLAAAACPSTTVSTGQDATGCVGGLWNGLRVRLPQQKLICSYEIVTGTGTGTNNPAGFSFTSPAGDWFYLLATCDGDGNTAQNATYFMASTSSSIEKRHEGS